jgi:glucose 1-dehydrogenase
MFRTTGGNRVIRADIETTATARNKTMVNNLTSEVFPDVVMPACPINRLLKGQKALVTGANSGIGKAIAIELAHAGADVVVNYRNGEAEAAAVVREAERCGSRAIAHRADVSVESEVETMFERAIDDFGTIDILVNNAGLQKDAPFEHMSLADWRTVLDVNLTGQFLCARAAVREFKRRGVRSEVSCAAGKIICISSVHEVIPWAGHVNYAASKGGVMLMMKSIAQEVAPYRIRVNSIAPGAIRTPINRSAWETPEAYRDLMKLIPYRRIGEPEDIGRAAVWLASDATDYITGTTLFIDGGMTLYPGFEAGG